MKQIYACALIFLMRVNFFNTRNLGINALINASTVTALNLSKAHETRDSLAVPVCRLSCSISIHFVAIHS